MLYHKDVFMPELSVEGVFLLTASKHAKTAALTDCRSITIPRAIVVSKHTVFEAEIIDGVLVKVCTRTPYNYGYSLCMALTITGRRTATVKTIWLNAERDNHRTLDVDKYAKAR